MTQSASTLPALPRLQSLAVRLRQRLGWDALVMVTLLVPLLVAGALVKAYAVDAPFNDDFTFAEDWIKLKDGTLQLSDLFTAHMEHRITVPRMMALAMHVIAGRDLRWQNAMTLLLMLGTGLNLLGLWRHTIGGTLRDAWLPLVLMSSVLFCAVQWQALLWPIMFEVFVPVFSFTLALRVWHSRLRPWTALGVAALCATAGTWSFANGPLEWLLVPLLLLVPKDGVDQRTRWRMAGAWVMAAGLMMFLYTLKFENKAPEQFAYGQGQEVTAWHSMKYFLLHPFNGIEFIAGVLGSHLSRGLHFQNIEAAEFIGWISLILLLGSCVWLWKEREDGALLRAAMPWVALCLFSAGTATFITMGRLWLTRSGSLAVTVRYVSHAVPMTLGLIALVWILGRRRTVSWRGLGQFGTAVGGALLCLTIVEWTYGWRNMQLWQETRLQGDALLLFTRVTPNDDFLGSVAGEGDYGARVAKAMDDRHLLHHAMLRNVDLRQFNISKATLRTRLASFEELRSVKDGTMEAQGFAELPNQRPADLVLFTQSTGPGVKRIFGFTTVLGMPRFWSETAYRDHEFCAVPSFTPAITAAWQPHLTLIEPPAKRAVIEAWALDVEKMRVYAIADGRAPASPRLPKTILPNDSNR